MEQPKSVLVDINEISQSYIKTSKKRIRRFIYSYLTPKKIGNRLYVSRAELEALLSDPDRENFPLNF